MCVEWMMMMMMGIYIYIYIYMYTGCPGGDGGEG